MPLHGGENRDTPSRRATHQEENSVMRVRSITTCALGLAAALTVAASTLAAQQDTTKLRRAARSDRRIPISKESPGEVVTTRVDTVYVTRTDTLTNTVVRV